MTADKTYQVPPATSTRGASKPRSSAGPNSSSDAPPTTWDWIYFYWQAFLHSGFPFICKLVGIKPHWYPSQMGDKHGEVILVTGGNSGTGYETAKAYYEHGATVYLGCRSEQRATEAIADIKKGATKDVLGKVEYKPLSAAQIQKAGTLTYINLDLADLTTVETAAEQILQKEKRLDVLFANAGIMATPPGQYTKQGYALQFGTNVLGHQRLISLLIPLLQKTSKAHPDSPSRIICTSSYGHQFAPKGGINYSSLVKGGKQLSEWEEYGESKWGNIALANYVNQHYGPRSAGAKDGAIYTFSLHPGMIATNLATHLSGFQRMSSVRSLVPLWQVAPSTGALNQIWAAEMDVAKAELLSGSYISCYQDIVPARPDTRNRAAVDKMWNWCEEQASKAK